MVNSVRIDPIIGECSEVRTDAASIYVLEKALIKKLMTVSTNTYFITECQQKLNRVKRKNKLQKIDVVKWTRAV